METDSRNAGRSHQKSKDDGCQVGRLTVGDKYHYKQNRASRPGSSVARRLGNKWRGSEPQFRPCRGSWE